MKVYLEYSGDDQGRFLLKVHPTRELAERSREARCREQGGDPAYHDIDEMELELPPGIPDPATTIEAEALDHLKRLLSFGWRPDPDHEALMVCRYCDETIVIDAEGLHLVHAPECPFVAAEAFVGGLRP